MCSASTVYKLQVITHMQDVKHFRDALFAICRHGIEHWPADTHRRRAQGDSFQDIGRTAYTAIYKDFEFGAGRVRGHESPGRESGYNVRKDGKWGRGKVLSYKQCREDQTVPSLQVVDP
jgi:hypothetical protein